MTKKYNLSLHIFRRDLRLEDNSALIEALKLSQFVIPCFIFDKRQIENNAYKSDNCIQFMVQSLKELDEQLKKVKSKLYKFYGCTENVISNLLSELPLEAIYINRDYTPFSLTRDEKIDEICNKSNIDFHAYADTLLHEPEEILKPNRQPYTVFTHFFNKAHQFPVSEPVKNTHHNYYQKNILGEDNNVLATLSTLKNLNILVKGGREEGLQLLKAVHDLENYQAIRNFPAIAGTSKLSAHNKFGTISIREFYHTIKKAFGANHGLISELYWRDFFTHIAFHYPRVFSEAFHDKYNAIKWGNNKNHFKAWCDGVTGFPIVDAGMRELNTTGYMHNRVRMVAASFLVKDLHIDWHWGEKYFAQQLVDYDPAVNNGNWQWVASTGCDAQPYFRIFNPWLQQQKFDPECVYIKRWVPELASLTPNAIHNITKIHLPLNYPRPIVDHAIQSQITKQLYRDLAERQS